MQIFRTCERERRRHHEHNSHSIFVWSGKIKIKCHLLIMKNSIMILFLYHILWAGNQTWWIDLQSQVKNNLLNKRRHSLSQIRHIHHHPSASTSALVFLIALNLTHVLFGFLLLRWLEVYFQITSMLRISVTLNWRCNFLLIPSEKITTPYKHTALPLSTWLSQLLVKEKITFIVNERNQTISQIRLFSFG